MLIRTWKNATLTIFLSQLYKPRSSSFIASSYATVGGHCAILEPHMTFLRRRYHQLIDRERRGVLFWN